MRGLSLHHEDEDNPSEAEELRLKDLLVSINPPVSTVALAI